MQDEAVLGDEGTEIEEEEMTMADWLEQESYEPQPVRKNSIIKGTVVSKRSSEIVVDIGSKYEGVIRAKDLDRVDQSVKDGINIGDEIHIFVMHLQDEDGYVELSLNKALVENDWHRAQEAFEDGTAFEGKVVSTNKGGLIVNFGAVRGFVPGSQLGNQHIARSEKSTQWQSMIGQTLLLKIIEVDRRRNRLILSERVAVEEQRKEQRDILLAELKEGDTRTGRVSSLADFGAFVDLGGAEGLVHLSELAWVQVSHPKEVLKVNQEVEVYVLSIDNERQRIGLSLKQLQPEPWTEVIDKYEVDQVVSAVITKLTTFGAFARVDNVLEGLIHISELSHRSINHPREVVSEGDDVQVSIISIDPQKRRMGLSLKSTSEPEIEWVDGDEDTAADDSVSGDEDIEASDTAETVVAEAESDVEVQADVADEAPEESSSDEADEEATDPEAVVA